MVKLINIGFGNMIAADRIVAIVSPDSAPVKRMIQEGNLNFTQIAEAVGYDNIYYFSTLFKKNTGMTLTEYSKSVRR